jgi:hypothetical protein
MYETKMGKMGCHGCVFIGVCGITPKNRAKSASALLLLFVKEAA